MQYLLPGAVFLLMVSVGMSLKLTEVVAHWRRMDRLAWTTLIVATFIIPPSLALLVANLFRLSLGDTAGLFMVGVAPGAPPSSPATSRVAASTCRWPPAIRSGPRSWSPS